MDHIYTQSGNGTDEVQSWAKWIILGLILGIAGLYWLFILLPKYFGNPLAQKAIQIMVPPDLYRDCELRRSLDVQERIYKMHGVSFNLSQSADPSPATCGPADATIYLAKSRKNKAGQSGLIKSSKCRGTEIDPEHLDFCKQTMSHEFAHHWFGDVGLPDCLSVLNAPYDCRNDFFIWLHT